MTNRPLFIVFILFALNIYSIKIFAQSNIDYLTFTKEGFDVIQIPPDSSLDLQEDFTISFRLSFDDVSLWSMLLCYDKRGGIEFSFTGEHSNNPGSIMLTSDGSTAGIIFAFKWKPQNNIWYDLTVIRQKNKYSVYVNNNLLNDTISKLSIPDYRDQSLRVGNWLISGYLIKSYNFLGKIDEFSIWNKDTLPSYPLKGNEHGLVLYYNMNVKDAKNSTAVVNRSPAGDRLNGVTIKTRDEGLVQYQNQMIKDINALKIRNRNYVVAFILIIVIVSILFSYWRFRIKQKAKMALQVQKEKEEERMRISKDLHDELGSGLSKIKFLSDLTLTENDKIEQNKKLVSISETSSNVVNNMKELIWLLNTEDVTFDTLAASIREYTTDYLEEFDIALEIKFPSSLPGFIVSKNAYRHLFMIVKEGLQNIVKHSKATKVKIELILDHELTIRIEDNGQGFDINQTKGHGLKNIRDRAKNIEGSCTIESNHGKGSMIEVKTTIKSLLE